ncbi:hypothetical protein [uncultured Winogradskyella sp.]|uniref:hypothetical protein n=1 Tax=uncultured Winogradskyella sp. TaxID=395353 RepID=UPI00351498B3
MITFIVPVKSKSACANWPNLCRLFDSTIRSIFNQADTRFNVVVVCHEIPTISFSHENLHFVEATFKPPLEKSIIDKRIDKGNKIKTGVEYAQNNFPSKYVVMVDADDYISNKLVHFLNNPNTDHPGWYIDKGFINYKFKRFLIFTKKFNWVCGSSVIVKPELINHYFDKGEIDLYFDHRLKVLNTDIVLKDIPFPAAIYNICNGENLLMSASNVKKFNDHRDLTSKQGLKRIYRKMRNHRLRIITARLRNEFNYHI